MDTVAHLYNVSQFMAGFKSDQAWNLQAFYAECCRKMSSNMELPNSMFGPSAACSHCGLLWRAADPKVRISRGRAASKSVARLIRIKNARTRKLPKACESLIRKSMKNLSNKVVMKCSLCKRNTEIQVAKPKKAKKVVKNVPDQHTKRHKRRKTKDKTSGLNVPGSCTPPVNTKPEAKTPVTRVNTHRSCKTLTPAPKLKKLNADRLKNVVKQGAETQKKKTLHNFLMELY